MPRSFLRPFRAFYYYQPRMKDCLRILKQRLVAMRKETASSDSKEETNVTRPTCETSLNMVDDDLSDDENGDHHFKEDDSNDLIAGGNLLSSKISRMQISPRKPGKSQPLRQWEKSPLRSSIFDVTPDSSTNTLCLCMSTSPIPHSAKYDFMISG